MAESQGQLRVYRCHQGGFLARAMPVEGVVIHDVYCRKCGKRHDLYLGEKQVRGECADGENAPETGRGIALPPARAVG